jgi:hypothetical protein
MFKFCKEAPLFVKCPEIPKYTVMLLTILSKTAQDLLQLIAGKRLKKKLKIDKE